MPELESVNLEHTNLRSFVLESLDNDVNKSSSSSVVLQHLKEIRLIGNPLRCDCHARWLWAIVRKQQQQADGSGAEKEGVAKIRIELPKCATPFSVRNMDLVNLKGTLYIKSAPIYVSICILFSRL